ncbi:MAG: putative toxin-antitoxin system toxin component, PIN family [Candidatus Chisholmbacteria bacterium RIFCSPHIGHO2_01_FULL_48_12]|uniref:Putative toxin-antitoxin system toxin component, PIN family n=1 Tax=Candidatus Chisholmbacteria bacterium RIFCSPHIGHO2_01_FULL_48_12 TaxID=1797589 RepID=A0A1G1VPX9_9BACT|nr:MAG: putative toxin-antitoxin system toxin component, PIN family [Candidatus Chisholmbacteria bacterium RIFCSPHIGHO2_01_FULL_48_12]
MSLSTESRVVIDTNVFISGVMFGGNPGKIVELLKKFKIKAVVSPDTAVELVTKFKKFRVTSETVEDLMYVIDNEDIKVVPKRKVKVVRDFKDNMFLEAAWAGRADYLVTGDKDLLVLGKFKGTKIVKPKEFLAAIDKGDGRGG